MMLLRCLFLLVSGLLVGCRSEKVAFQFRPAKALVARVDTANSNQTQRGKKLLGTSPVPVVSSQRAGNFYKQAKKSAPQQSVICHGAGLRLYPIKPKKWRAAREYSVKNVSKKRWPTDGPDNLYRALTQLFFAAVALVIGLLGLVFGSLPIFFLCLAVAILFLLIGLHP
ncbi:hypothetical protein J0X19_15860 [Hymenobacter sp. BT186]|uniref:Uncharacterized protein n=1 Tax=Hymenobacter telluris TaxID=2816474 RepID=A0A939JDI7_9BACT|nr:hypothetical protein [Hymenobacter telluris]MBO0359440.1 hypothetical protein [Hymenobacter telluris]MBW3375466.1 hypothetical protein [Hymenobacter norwichensis]